MLMVLQHYISPVRPRRRTLRVLPSYLANDREVTVNGIYHCHWCKNIWAVQLPEGWVTYISCPNCLSMSVERLKLEEAK